MPVPPILLAPDAPAEDVAAGMAAVRTEQAVPERFPPAVDAEVRSTVDRPRAAGASPRRDRTDVVLVTIDPPGSRDLDQAYGAERGRAAASGSGTPSPTSPRS